MHDDAHVFVSPHRDDVCFSLGALAATVGGRLINVFTQSQYSIGTESDFSRATIEHVTRTRHMEDQAFMRECRLRETDLRWQEAPLRKRAPFDVTDRNGEVAALEPALREALDEVGELGDGKPWLFSPMGIGRHRDHLIVRDIVIGNLKHLEQRFRIAFYEDLHYASRKEHRGRGIADFVSNIGGAFTRTALPLGQLTARKLFLIQLYASQFETLPTGLEQFSPAAAGTPLHEAIWARESCPYRLPV